ncbi:hypothetical protein Hanom_Chr07g00588351 [Helianthus anomalus]
MTWSHGTRIHGVRTYGRLCTGSYIMRSQNVLLEYIPTTRPLTYSLNGFIWAFKIWIFEVFPYARKFAVKRDGIPRAISWDENQRITWELALPFVLDATVPGFEPLQVLTPTPAESATDWWRASRQFLESSANDYSPPSKKKARLSFQPRSSDKARDQLADDIATTATTTTTTLPSSDDTASYRTMDREKELMEIELQKLLVMTRLTRTIAF